MSNKTALYNIHIRQRAKMINFSGWELPLEYGSSLKEAQAVRENCGLFDVSHMGEIEVEGKGGVKLLQYLTANDISRLKQGQVQYNLFINPQGGIIDDFLIYNRKGSYLCVVNASNREKVLRWLEENKTQDTRIRDVSSLFSLISLQGPKAAFIMEEILGPSVKELKYMHFLEGEIEGRKVIISRSGYTGEDGFEVFISWEEGPFLWDLIMKKGKNYGLCLCGLGARDILRIEAGYPLYGQEIDENVDPFEASLGWVVKFGKEFIGKDKLLEIYKNGLPKLRVGICMEDRCLPRQNYPIYAQKDKKVIGSISSGTYSPNLNKFISMGYVLKEYSSPLTSIEIMVRGKFYKGKIVKIPFIDSNVP